MKRRRGAVRMGRPSDYTAEIAAAICERIGGAESLRTICTAEDMPNKATVFRWLAAHADFRDQYARAREVQAEALAEELLEIADDGTNDFKLAEGRDGAPVQVVDHEHISRSKLRVDARKWLAAKLAPKKYGDRITQEVTGANGAPLVPVINISGRTEPPSAS